MAEKLIKHLKEMGSTHTHIQLLNAQWEFDQELIPKALQNVGSTFPHYSRHDASHSRQILINIERLLGENLHQLTATDTWLLLEAAYWHDIGMVVTSDQIVKDLSTEAFSNYLHDLASQSGHELQAFAKQFGSLNPKSCFASADTPQQAVALYRQLLSGWYRGKHQERAEKVVGDPWSEVGIASPRNELVPRRLFRTLGTICRLHGGSFDSVLSELPFAEAGMGSEDCHPRFVACMLRLGDLFDLDDNRFCPAMLRTAGEIPPSSQAHIDKHAAIRHMRLDTDCIELMAECSSYASYEITDEWFTWIREEMRNQMSRWKDIAPSREFGLLPTLGKMEVNLAPPDEILDPGERPRFGVDHEKILELLQGAGLYESAWQSVRELLQNAVDATLLRVWLSHGDQEGNHTSSLDWEDPNAEGVRAILNKYPIQVAVSRSASPQGDGKVPWRLTIHDQGLGIRKQDLGFMKNVGGSAKNSNKYAIINRMPLWLRPSGAFGIGLQSAFLITDEINFQTKSMLTGDALYTRMTSPMGRERGMIYIHRFEAHPGHKFGTTMGLEIVTDAIPSQISLSWGPSLSQEILARFDPITQEDVPYEASKLVEEILEFSKLSPVPIELLFDEKPMLTGSGDEYKHTDKYYDVSTGIMLYDVRFRPDDAFRSFLSFRGQPVDKWKHQLPFVSFTADMLTANATEVLTINRNEIKDSVSDKVLGQIVEAIIGYLRSSPEQPVDPAERSAASAFLFLHSKSLERTDLTDLWHSLCPRFNPAMSIAELCNQPKFTVALTDPIAPGEQSPNVSFADYRVDSHGSRHWVNLLIHRWRKELGRSIQIDRHSGTISAWVLRFDREQQAPFSEVGFRTALLHALSNAWGIAGRFHAPAWGKFERLAAHTERLSWCRSISEFHFDGPQLVLPFFIPATVGLSPRTEQITTQSLEALCAWTVKNSMFPDINSTEVLKLYEEFIDWTDNSLMKGEPRWADVRKT